MLYQSMNAAKSSEISEEGIGRLVDAFYAKVRLDAEISPIFNAVVDDWPHHLAVLKDFWSTVLLTTGRYKGDPAMRHLGLGLDPQHFERWLALFAETANENFSAESAAYIVEKAQRIGRSLQEAAAFVKERVITR
jgi:hemoglobin